jgi:hypothetical protein
VSGPVGAGVLFGVEFDAEFDAVVGGGASPTGFAGLTSSNGAFLSTVGPDFGGGPSNVSGVGVGVGATRRGRDDCARKEVTVTNTKLSAKRANVKVPILGIRFFMRRILSDFEQNLQIKSRKPPVCDSIYSGRGRGDISDAGISSQVRRICAKLIL